MKEVNISIDVDTQMLKEIIKDAVKEAIEEEFMKLRLTLLSYISDSEQKEIEEKYGKPSDDFVRKINIE